MARKIQIQVADIDMTATLNQSVSADKLWDILPTESPARVWGDEVYFDIPMHVDEDNAQAKVPSGTIAFWPQGDCFCIFFGQTPYSPVNVLGALDGDPKRFADVKDGHTVRLSRVE